VRPRVPLRSRERALTSPFARLSVQRRKRALVDFEILMRCQRPTAQSQSSPGEHVEKAIHRDPAEQPEVGLGGRVADGSARYDVGASVRHIEADETETVTLRWRSSVRACRVVVLGVRRSADCLNTLRERDEAGGNAAGSIRSPPTLAGPIGHLILAE
jgi:hypothetical protein